MIRTNKIIIIFLISLGYLLPNEAKGFCDICLIDISYLSSTFDTLPIKKNKSEVLVSSEDGIVKFLFNGKPKLTLTENANGHLLFNLPANISNTFFGTNAGQSFLVPTSASKHNKNIANTFIGFNAGKKVQNGKQNTFLGASTGTNIPISFGSTFVGANAGEKLKKGDWNTFIGALAGNNLMKGEGNVMVGYGAGEKINETDNSIFIGHLAGNEGGQGGNNIFIGKDAGRYSKNTKNNIFIGTGAGENQLEDNTLIIGDNRNKTPLIYGKFDERFLQINGKVGLHVIHGDNPQLDGFTIQREGVDSLSWRMYVSEDNGDLHFYNKKAKARSESSIAIIDAQTGAYLTVVNPNMNAEASSMESALENILKLKPKLYQPSGRDEKINIGFVPEEIQEVYPDLLIQDKEVYHLNYSGLNVYAIKAMQEQHNELAELKSELNELTEALKKQLALLEEIEKKRN